MAEIPYLYGDIRDQSSEVRLQEGYRDACVKKPAPEKERTEAGALEGGVTPLRRLTTGIIAISAG